MPGISVPIVLSDATEGELASETNLRVGEPVFAVETQELVIGQGAGHPPVRFANTEQLQARGGAIRTEFPLPPNLIDNTYMSSIIDGVPEGYSGGGVTLLAVSPYVRGFEGVYASTAPSNAAATPAAATDTAPYWYGANNKGPRLTRSGLADGWVGGAGGHLLKITAAADPSRFWTTVFFPWKRNVATNRIGFRGYLKIATGNLAGLGTDAGANGHLPGAKARVTKTQTDAASQGWYFLDFITDTSQTASLGQTFVLGFSRETDLEAYLALPYAYVPAGARPGIVTE